MENQTIGRKSSHKRFLSLLLPLIFGGIATLLVERNNLLSFPSSEVVDSSTESGLLGLDYAPSDQCTNTALSSRFKCCSDPSYPVLGGIDIVGTILKGQSGKTVLGIPEYEYSLYTTHGTYQFYFQSRSNLEKFSIDPWKYVPTAGGFAADVFADEIAADPAMLSKLDLSSDARSWEFSRGHFFLTSGQQLFSEAELAAIETKAGWIWGYLFSEGESIFNTQCITGFVEDSNAQVPLLTDDEDTTPKVLISVVTDDNGNIHIVGTGMGTDMQVELRKDEDGHFDFVMRPKKKDFESLEIEPKQSISPQDSQKSQNPVEDETGLLPVKYETATQSDSSTTAHNQEDRYQIEKNGAVDSFTHTHDTSGNLNEKKTEKETERTEKEVQKEAERVQKEAEKEASKELILHPTPIAIPLFQEGKIGITIDGIPIAAVPLIGGVPFPQNIAFDLDKGRTFTLSNELPSHKNVDGNRFGSNGNGFGRPIKKNGQIEDEVQTDEAIPVTGIDLNNPNKISLNSSEESKSGTGSLFGLLVDVPVAGLVKPNS